MLSMLWSRKCSVSSGCGFSDVGGEEDVGRIRFDEDDDEDDVGKAEYGGGTAGPATDRAAAELYDGGSFRPCVRSAVGPSAIWQ
jgi:hypothetical protein